MLRGGLHGGLGLRIGSLLGLVRRVRMVVGVRVRMRRMGGVKGGREGRSTPGPGLVVEGRGASEGRPGGTGRRRGNKNFDLVQLSTHCSQVAFPDVYDRGGPGEELDYAVYITVS